MSNQYTKSFVRVHDIIKGSEAFRRHEPRGAMYKVATFLIKNFWGSPAEMADALGVLLLTWNQALYRYGAFDFARLERVLDRRMAYLTELKAREIASLTDADIPAVEELFACFLDALRIADGNLKGRRSPVAVAKALHLLAPHFFPLWDDKIAKAYKCRYGKNPAATYVGFMRLMKSIAAGLQGNTRTDGSSILKLIDEYNYAKFTKKWI